MWKIFLWETILLLNIVQKKKNFIVIQIQEFIIEKKKNIILIPLEKIDILCDFNNAEFISFCQKCKTNLFIKKK